MLFPVQTIIGTTHSFSQFFIEKTASKDFKFFLGHRNFLKVVDTLEKFEQSILDENSKQVKDFAIFKRQLYKMYEIQNRSAWEHERFSFEIERENLTLLKNANENYLNEVVYSNTID